MTRKSEYQGKRVCYNCAHYRQGDNPKALSGYCSLSPSLLGEEIALKKNVRKPPSQWLQGIPKNEGKYWKAKPHGATCRDFWPAFDRLTD